MNIQRVPYRIKQMLFQSIFKGGHVTHIVNLSYNLTSDDFELDLGDILTSSANEDSHVASMTQFWLKSIKHVEGRVKC